MGIGLALGGSTYASITDNGLKIAASKNLELEKVSARGSFNEINVDVLSGDVEIVESEFSGYDIAKYDIGRLRHSIEGDVLQISEIKEKNAGWWKNSFNVGMVFNYGRNEKITVYIEKGADIGNIDIKVTSGRIITDGFIAEKVSIGATSGSITIKNCTAETLRLNATSGSVAAENCKAAGAMIVNATSGHVRINNCDANEIKAGTSSGRLVINGGSADFYDIFASSGALKATDITSGGLNAKVTSGALNIAGVLLGRTDIDITSGSGVVNVTGKKSEYAVRLSSTSGSCRIDGDRKSFWDGEDAEHTVAAKTTSGRLKVNFN
jgi:DUF4097 and DUF4098 domain-containing protein YvlB